MQFPLQTLRWSQVHFELFISRHVQYFALFTVLVVVLWIFVLLIAFFGIFFNVGFRVTLLIRWNYLRNYLFLLCPTCITFLHDSWCNLRHLPFNLAVLLQVWKVFRRLLWLFFNIGWYLLFKVISRFLLLSLLVVLQLNCLIYGRSLIFAPTKLLFQHLGWFLKSSLLTIRPMSRLL